MTPKPSTPNHIERQSRRWEVSLSLVLITLSLAISAVMMTLSFPVTTTQPTSSASFPAQLRGAVHRLRVENLIRYLWPKPIAPDPALPSIMNYIRVHEALEATFYPTAPITAEDTQVYDPNVWSVYAYLRAHGQLP